MLRTHLELVEIVFLNGCRLAGELLKTIVINFQLDINNSINCRDVLR